VVGVAEVVIVFLSHKPEPPPKPALQTHCQLLVGELKQSVPSFAQATAAPSSKHEMAAK
jgi:hypothetical protein